MRLCYHARLSEQLAAAPLPIRKAFDRKLHLLVRDLRHPSLRAKKYDEAHRRVFRRPLTAGEAWSFVDAMLASAALGILVPGERHQAVVQRIGHDVSPGGEIHRFGIAAPRRMQKR